MGTLVNAPTNVADAFQILECYNYGTLTCSTKETARKGGMIGYTGAGAFHIVISHYELNGYDAVGLDQVTAKGGSIKITDLR